MEEWVQTKLNVQKKRKEILELAIETKLSEVRKLREDLEECKKEIGVCFAIAKRIQNGQDI